ADIMPRVDKNVEKLSVDITYVIEKGKEVYFERILISGNTKTRDKVIRRELPVYEQELYSGQKLKRGVRNLYRLDFFEDIKVDTAKGSSDDKMVLKIDLKEKPTGAFTFGGGYSSVESFFLTGSVSQKNMQGLGQVLQLKAQFGGITNRYTVSFTEPWLFDIPLSGGFDLYNWDTEYDTYDKHSIGGGLRSSYLIFDFTRAYISYSYETANIENVTVDAPDVIKEMIGENVTSTITTSLDYDSRDRIFNPTEGSQHTVTFQYSGLGGDVGFTKYLIESGKYFPLFWDTVGFLHGACGFVYQNPAKKLPSYERFYLGGLNSLRGFKWQELSPVDNNGIKIGGNKFVQFNVEYLIPLIKKAGLVGVVFYDTGNVWDNNVDIDLGNLRRCAGYGFRWYSPIGPIRLECGYILDKKDGESEGGRWDFTMGTAF
ncbi:MAG: outer membrane protein assembly factor BamA, partial [Desulfobacterales bacterium]|nr:outer membrane protein assembly factor BamA [Desulfobacterales bacterium]